MTKISSHNMENKHILPPKAYSAGPSFQSSPLPKKDK